MGKKLTSGDLQVHLVSLFWDENCPTCRAIERAIIESNPEVDEDWLIAKANAVLYALRRRFRSTITAADTAMMRDLLADVVMAAGVKVKDD